MSTEIENPYMLEGTTENTGGSHPVTWALAHSKEPNAQLAAMFVDAQRAKYFLDTLCMGITTGATLSSSRATITFDNGTKLWVFSQEQPSRCRGIRLDYSWIELGCSDDARLHLSMSTRGPELNARRPTPRSMSPFDPSRY